MPCQRQQHGLREGRRKGKREGGRRAEIGSSRGNSEFRGLRQRAAWARWEQCVARASGQRKTRSGRHRGARGPRSSGQVPCSPAVLASRQPSVGLCTALSRLLCPGDPAGDGAQHRQVLCPFCLPVCPQCPAGIEKPHSKCVRAEKVSDRHGVVSLLSAPVASTFHPSNSQAREATREALRKAIP